MTDVSIGTDRVLIDAGIPDFHVIVSETVSALAKHPDLYQRGGNLVLVTADGRVHRIERNALAVTVSECASYFVMAVGEEGEPNPRQVQPPAKVVHAVHALGIYDGVRHLDRVVDVPVLRSDGTIAAGPGYDPKSRVYITAASDVTIPEVITESEISEAKGLLDELLIDFPFERPCDKGAALAALFTLVGQATYDGPAPLFLVNASIAGAGKSLLIRVLVRIATGRWPSVTPPPEHNDEARKMLLSLAIAGDTVLVYDNVPTGKAFGYPALDAALTTTHLKDRILGASLTFDGPFRPVVLASGNNIGVQGDTGRRVIPLYLRVDAPRPELREGFRHPDLEKWVMENRNELLRATLILLSVSIRAGVKPSARLGSYEAWSEAIRACVEYHYGIDPTERQQEYRERADEGEEVFELFIAAAARVKQPIPPSSIIQMASTNLGGLLANALRAACPADNSYMLPSAHKLGRFLRAHEKKPSSGMLAIYSVPIGHGQTGWYVAPTFFSHGFDPRFAEELAHLVTAAYGTEPFTIEELIQRPELLSWIRKVAPSLDARTLPAAMRGLLLTTAGDKWVILEDPSSGVWSLRPRTPR